MKYDKLKALPLLLLLPISLSAQFYVSSGSTFYATTGTLLNFDSLTIIPNLPINTSSLTINKTNTPVAGIGGNSINKVYNINGTLTISGTVGMFVASNELNGNNMSALQIAYDSGTGYITTNSSTVNTSVGYVSNVFSTPITFNKLTAVNSNVVLPIKLIDFNAIKDGGYVKINWTTAIEQNTEKFIVEKSTDGIFFTELLTRKAKGGTEQKHYIDYDYHPEIGLNYYRLVDIDYGGRKNYSTTKTVRFDSLNEQHTLSIYPNPATDVVFAEVIGKVPQQAHLTITDINGKAIMKLVFDQKKISFNITHLAKGVYFARYSDGYNSHVFKLDKL